MSAKIGQGFGLQELKVIGCKLKAEFNPCNLTLSTCNSLFPVLCSIIVLSFQLFARRRVLISKWLPEAVNRRFNWLPTLYIAVCYCFVGLVFIVLFSQSNLLLFAVAALYLICCGAIRILLEQTLSPAVAWLVNKSTILIADCTPARQYSRSDRRVLSTLKHLEREISEGRPDEDLVLAIETATRIIRELILKNRAEAEAMITNTQKQCQLLREQRTTDNYEALSVKITGISSLLNELYTLYGELEQMLIDYLRWLDRAAEFVTTPQADSQLRSWLVDEQARLTLEHSRLFGEPEVKTDRPAIACPPEPPPSLHRRIMR